MFSVCICGGSGYAGLELLRLLSKHPDVKITSVTSEKSSGKKIEEIFPSFKGILDLTYEPLVKEDILKKADIFFLSLPHGTSQEIVDFLYRKGKIVIDLSADYRIHDSNIYQEWYGIPHGYPETLKESIYGLPEIYRERIKNSRLIANPGCYPTGALIPLYVLLKKRIINPDGIVIDSKSGVSGAGRKSDVIYSFCEINESFRPYGIARHRHTPEMEEVLTEISGRWVKVDFTPHLLPVQRGILTTIYAKLNTDLDTDELLNIFKKEYANEPFIRIYDKELPDIKFVRGTNFCDISCVVNKRTGTVIIVSAIDNLVKGAAGQAVQNMNIVLRLDETRGILSPSLFP